MTFPCTSCGLCCRSVGKWVSMAQSMPEALQAPEIKEIANFPFATDSNGVCSQLDENNHCRIYATRPRVCSIEKMWEKYHSYEKSLSQYFAEASVVCNSMMDEAGLPEELRVVC